MITNRYVAKPLEALYDLCSSTDDNVRLAAAVEILNRVEGRNLGSGVAKELPRPDVYVRPGETNVAGETAIDVTISRDGKERSYHGTGLDGCSATGDAIKKILSDPVTAEWLP